MTAASPAAPAQIQGYWAVEVLMADADALRPQYLCHAAGDHAMTRAAARLMGAVRNSQGFNYYPVKLPIAGQSANALPGLGDSIPVLSGGWSNLMDANAAWLKR